VADELLTDDQEADRAKQWLRENGAFLAAGIVLGLGGLFGWQQWQDYKLEHAGKASIVWEQLRVAIDGDRFNEVSETLALLESDYPETPYMDQARLSTARMHMNKNEPELAAEQLRLLTEGTQDDNIRRIAELRLAQILLFQQEHEEALSVLEGTDYSAFAGQYHELRGDIYLAMGELTDAQTEYTLAIASLEDGVINREFVSMKLDDLTGALVVSEPELPETQDTQDTQDTPEPELSETDVSPVDE